jgi:hypothetical protein
VTARTGSPVALAAVALALGLVGTVPGPVAAGLAALCSATYALPLLRRAAAAPSTTGRVLVPLAVGLLCAAGSAVGAATAHLTAPGAHLGGVPLPAEVPLVGLFFTVGAYLLGLLPPGPPRSLTTRLRAALDGLSVGLTVLYTAWLLVFSPSGVRGGGLT